MGGEELVGVDEAEEDSFVVRLRADPGSTPGTLVVDPDAPPPRLRLTLYDAQTIERLDLPDVEALRPFLSDARMAWVEVEGLGDAEVLQDLATMLEMHRLVIEDVVNVHQRCKLEEYGESLFFVMRRLDVHGAHDQLSIHVAAGLVVTFAETHGPGFPAVHRRLDRGGRIRHRGAPYLCYAILDTLVDGHFPVLEALGNGLEVLEDRAFATPPDPGVLERLHAMRRRLLQVRRVVWPMREMLAASMREGVPLVDEKTRLYLRDVLDHVVQQIDIVENLRELASGLIDVHRSNVSERMNEIMKLLTVVATLFIPLSFVAGLYGMNFDTSSDWNLPELSWRYGYLYCLGLMAALSIGMMIWFRRLGLIGSGSSNG